MAFTHLHVHTEYSLLDGSNKIKEYVSRVKELGMNSAAITDHGVMYGCIDFYRAAKEAGINTAMESMACAPMETIDKLLPWLDQYLMDIKHMDSGKHKEFTGKGNELMLENARKIAESGKTELIIRVPVIPTFNDTEKEIEEIARFSDTLPGVKRIPLLPYHRLGQDKYEGLGREYLMKDILPPANEHMESLKRAVERVSGLDCHIGG